MEISGIDKIQTVHKLVKNDTVQATRLEDTLSISSDVQKKAEWVEMLKHMPDIRLEKIEAVLSQPAQNNISAVAQKIVLSGF